MITHYVQENPRWDLVLPMITFAYNTANNTSTKASPFYLIYGREPKLPIDVAIERQQKPSNPYSVNKYVTFVEEQWPEIREMAMTFTNSAKESQKFRHDRDKDFEFFREGDKVMLKNDLKETKFSPLFKGPYVVEKRIGETTYEIRNLGEKADKKKAHIHRLKKYYEPDKPSGSTTGRRVIRSMPVNHREKKKSCCSGENAETLLCLLLILNLFPSHFAFSIAPFIKWKNSNKPIVKGQITHNIMIAIKAPCPEIEILTKRQALLAPDDNTPDVQDPLLCPTDFACLALTPNGTLKLVKTERPFNQIDIIDKNQKMAITQSATLSPNTNCAKSSKNACLTPNGDHYVAKFEEETAYCYNEKRNLTTECEECTVSTPKDCPVCPVCSILQSRVIDCAVQSPPELLSDIKNLQRITDQV
uniref:Integrase catalytic domain-containing protein n=1 Tax=Tetranychus urticae TaxID=32264 RepID=A0A158P5K3_TETUR